MNWLSLWPQYFSQRTLWGVQFFFSAKRKMLFSVLVLGKFCSWGQDSFPLPGGCPGSLGHSRRKRCFRMKGDLHRDWSPSRRGEKEHHSCCLVLLPCVWLAIRADRDCTWIVLTSGLQIFLKVEHYQFFQSNFIKPLLHFHCWILFFFINAQVC